MSGGKRSPKLALGIPPNCHNPRTAAVVTNCIPIARDTFGLWHQGCCWGTESAHLPFC